MGGREWIRVRARADTDGFMIEPSRFGTQVPAAHAELDETCVLRVLWAGRDLDWKRVRDIERAVALANTKLVWIGMSQSCMELRQKKSIRQCGTIPPNFLRDFFFN